MDLPGLENDFDLLVTNGLGEHHADSFLLLRVGPARLADESVDVLKLVVVVVLVLDLLVKSLGEFAGSAGNHLN